MNLFTITPEATVASCTALTALPTLFRPSAETSSVHRTASIGADVNADANKVEENWIACAIAVSPSTLNLGIEPMAAGTVSAATLVHGIDVV